jgi:hypothetical protein
MAVTDVIRTETKGPTPARQDLLGKTSVFRTPDLPEQHLRVTRSDDHP